MATDNCWMCSNGSVQTLYSRQRTMPCPDLTAHDEGATKAELKRAEKWLARHEYARHDYGRNLLRLVRERLLAFGNGGGGKQ